MTNVHRKSPRLQHEVLVQVSSSEGTFTGWGTNLSKGGVFVNAGHAPPVGTEVSLLLQLPGQAECKLRGRVAWTKDVGPEVDEPGLGVQFVEPDAATQAVLEAMVQRLSADLSPVQA